MVFFPFFIFVTRIWMLYHRAIIYETNIKKEVLDKHFIFHGLRHFNFQPCFNSTLKWNATNFDGWFWCVDSRFFKTASSQPWICFALYFSFISFVCFRHIFFNIFFQHCLPPFFVVRPEMRSNSFFSYNSFLMFFLCANICVMNARWSSLNAPFTTH